jgi:hypothetical protein
MIFPDSQTPSLTSVVMRAVAAFVPFTHSRRSTRRRVSRWCRRQGYELLRWRDAKLFEGPSSWDAHERHYRIQIIDADGYRRAAYLTFARKRVFERCTEVLWDDPSGRTVPGSPDAPLTEDDDTTGLVPVALPR